MAKSEEELKDLLMNVKDESFKAERESLNLAWNSTFKN